MRANKSDTSAKSPVDVEPPTVRAIFKRQRAEPAIQVSDRARNPRHSALLQWMRDCAYTKLSVLVWPVCFLGAAAILWSSTLSDLRLEREHALSMAKKDASYLAKAYGEQISLTVGQIAQIANSIKYVIEKSSGQTFRLEEQVGKGLFPDTAGMNLSIFDRTGILVLTSPWGVPKKKLDTNNPISIADAPHFIAARDNPSATLVISKPMVDRLPNRTVIRFSDRINAPDGSFAGLLSIAVSPEYLARFYDLASLRPSDYLSLRSSDGSLIVTRINGKVNTVPTVLRKTLVIRANGEAAEYDGSFFYDNEARIIASARVAKYPLVTLAGSKKSEVLAAYHRDAASLITNDSVITFLMGLATAAGLMGSLKSLRQKRESSVSRQAYQKAIEGSEESYYSIRAVRNPQGQVVDFILDECNERGAEFVNAAKERIIGAKCSALFSQRTASRLFKAFEQTMSTGSYDDEIYLRPTDTRPECWVARHMIGTISGLAITARDITATKQHLVQVNALTYADPLTALPNRSWLSNHLSGAIAAAHVEQRAMALLFIDIDDFKAVNNTIGHRGGDEVLKTVALRLVQVVDSGDYVVRMGADEFAILLEQNATSERVTKVAECLLAAFVEPVVLVDAGTQIISASIGISHFPDDGTEADVLVRHAGIAMDAAKQAGKARYQYYERHLSDRLTFRRNIETDLRNAIANDEFVLHYQPRVDTVTGEIVSMEALLRWIHPIRGMMQPLDFILLAEETGQIVPIGAIVINKVCAQIALWKTQGVTPVPVSINVSPRQFNQRSLHGTIEQAMYIYGIHPSLVEFEITESCMMGEDKVVTSELASIQALGIKLLVDDFGTGYSSLSQLQRLDLDILKVDRAFTSNLVVSTEGEIFFKAIISMAHALGMSVVAEGVETLEELRILQRLECNEVQGYFVSRPVAAEAMKAMLVKRHLLEAVITL